VVGEGKKGKKFKVFTGFTTVMTDQCCLLQKAFEGQQCDHLPSPLHGYNPGSAFTHNHKLLPVTQSVM